MSSPLPLWSGGRNSPVVELIRAAWRVHVPLSLTLTGFILLASVLPAGLAMVSGVLVGRLAGASSAGTGITVTAAALGVFFLVQQIVPPVATAVAEALGRRLNRSVDDRVLAALHRPVGVEHLQDPRTGDLVATINGGAGGAHTRDAVVGVVNMGILRLGAVGSGLVLLGYRWWLAVLLLAAYGYAMVRVSAGYQVALTSAEGAPARLRRAMYLRDLACSAAPAKDVRVFGLADWLVDLYRGEWARAMAETRHHRRDTGRVSLLSSLVVLGAQALTFALLAVDLRDGRLSIAECTTFVVAATGLLAMNMVGPELLNISMGGAVLRSVGELETRLASFPSDSSGRPARLRGAIVFEQVGFRYPGSDRWALRGLDLTITAGTSTAVVGFNGAGKTTLVHLLCGLYQPTEGRILVDGTDLRDLDRSAWQRRCAALFQDWLRWPLSLRANVELGAPDQPQDADSLERVARGAGLGGVVGSLPDGWSTVLSREFDGVDLSGGQWQRVGLARALWAVQSGADLLVLDEPTSALDVRGESELFDLLLTAAIGKTVVLISHRFSTVRRADRIVVLDDGRVREQGDHDTLTAAGDHYAAMFTAQAKRFSERPAPR